MPARKGEGLPKSHMGPLAGLGSFNRLAGRRGRSGSSPRLPVTLTASRFRAGCSSRALDNRWDCVNLDVVLYFIFFSSSSMLLLLNIPNLPPHYSSQPFPFGRFCNNLECFLKTYLTEKAKQGNEGGANWLVT